MVDPHTPLPPLAPVLVVDDEDTIRNLLALVVTRAGGQPDLAATAAEARELAGRTDYACALIDKNLPDASGVEVLAHLREHRPRTECLMVTGYGNMESAIEALRLGALDYILKPFDILAVQQRVKNAIERRRLRDERDRLLDELRVANARLAESRQELSRAYLESILRLSRVAEHRDEGAGSHVARVSRYAGLLGRALDATEEWVENLVFAAPLHDIGMIAVPDQILTKSGPLEADERAAVNEHVHVGARILEGITADVMTLGREIVLTHHERWDGTGYPRCLRGDEIPLAGRIVAIADAWDAMTSDRPYRKAMSADDAVAELRRCAGTQFDENLVAALCDNLPRFVAVSEE